MLISTRLRALVWILLTAFATFCGCSQNEVRVFPVSGQVTFQGKPTKGALVVFHRLDPPESWNETPRAYVLDDGSFSMTTRTRDDGAPAGSYAVTIVWQPQDDEDEDPGPNLLPRKYSNPDTSGLVVEVEGPTTLPPFELPQ